MVPVEAPQTAPGSSPAAPTRSVRRATARRASSRRASARRLKRDTETSVIGFLTGHPGSSTGDIARGLDLHPDHVATCLTQLIRCGDVDKTSHGYEAHRPE